MKALGCAVLTGLVVVAGFFGVVTLVLTDSDDQSALTQRVEVTVIEPREERKPDQGTGYQFDYAYRHDRQWYAGKDWVSDDSWKPQDGLSACIDPGNPGAHVVTVRDQPCGQEFIVGGSVVRQLPGVFGALTRPSTEDPARCRRAC